MKFLVLGSGAAGVSADGESWVLLNAAPDIAQQVRAHPQLHARAGTAIKAVVLLDAQIDHVTGLLGLRDGPCIDVYATPCVFEDLTGGLPLLNVLQHYCGTRWHMLPVAGDRVCAEFEIEGFDALRFTALAIEGKAPPYSLHRREPVVGDNIALMVEDLRDGRRLFYSPGTTATGEVHEDSVRRRMLESEESETAPDDLEVAP
jgi:pyrroloquinoline quinone biosynthesis protein B